MEVRIKKATFPGFTLIELLVVIAIISVLAVGLLILVNPKTQLDKANDTRRKSDLAQIQRALETYYQDNNRYPPASNKQISFGSSQQQYMASIPKDPKDPTMRYVYGVSLDGQQYVLYSSLERGINDSQSCDKDTCTQFGSSPFGILQTDCGAGAGKCNYGVSSPNIKR